MKQVLLVAGLCFTLFTHGQQASSDGGIFKKAGGILNKVKGGSKTSLTNEDIVAGLKEALSVGATNSSNKLSATDGFFANAVIKVLMPEEAKKVESTLRAAGMGSMVDKAILSMNRAAEEASKSAAPIFLDAVKKMSFQDALGILKGHDSAATGYLKGKTLPALTAAFRPIIEDALQKTNATKHWKDVFDTYNKLSFRKVNTDLPAYVTERAMGGLFYQVALEEQKIRKDPAARVSDVLKKVFG